MSPPAHLRLLGIWVFSAFANFVDSVHFTHFTHFAHFARFAHLDCVIAQVLR